MLHEVTLDDLSQINRIYNHSSRHFQNLKKTQGNDEFATRAYLRNKERKFVCVKEGKTILGYTVFHIINPVVTWISDFEVDNFCEQEEISRELLNYIDNFSRERKTSVLATQAYPEETGTINLYLDNGFEIVNDKTGQAPYNRIINPYIIPEATLLAKIIGLYKI